MKCTHLVDNDCYNTRLVVYIHNNPQKHGFVDDFRDWLWSSYHALVSDKPTHIRRDQVLNWFGGISPFTETHGKDAAIDPNGLEDL